MYIFNVACTFDPKMTLMLIFLRLRLQDMLLSSERYLERVVERLELEKMLYSVNKTLSPFLKRASSEFP